VGSRKVSIGQSCRKRINASQTFSETILRMDALRATLASISEAHGVFISVVRHALRDAAAFGGALLSAGQGEATL